MSEYADFLTLYREAPKLSDVKDLGTEEYRCFSLKRGLPAAVVSSERHLDLLPHVPYLYDFYRIAKIFWMIPCATVTGVVYGFVFRSLAGKEYRIWQLSREQRLLFGWEGFGDFKENDPIVVTEGVKDALVLQSVYPHVLACLTSALSLSWLEFLSRMTNRFVLAGDNDEIGNKMSGWMRKRLLERGCMVERMLPFYGDFGAMVRGNLSMLKLQVTTALSRIGYFLGRTDE